MVKGSKVVLLGLIFLMACTNVPSDSTKLSQEKNTIENKTQQVEKNKDLVSEQDYMNEFTQQDKDLLAKLDYSVSIPKLNMDTPYAHYINESAKKVAMESLLFKAISLKDDPSLVKEEIGYSYTVNEGVISLILKEKIFSKEGEMDHILESYHIDDKGQRLSLSQVLDKLEYPKELKEQVKNKGRIMAEKEAKKMNWNKAESSEYLAGFFAVIDENWERIDSYNNPFFFYVDKEGKVNILHYMESELMSQFIQLDKREEEAEINPLFEAMGLESEKEYGLYYLGQVVDETSFDQATLKSLSLYKEYELELPWLTCHYKYNHDQDQEKGQELYLIVPKYRNALVKSLSNYYDETTGKEQDLLNSNTVGDSLVLCNPLAGEKDIKIEIQQKDKKAVFFPSQKEGKAEVEKEGIDISGQIKEIKAQVDPNKEPVKSILERLQEQIPKG